MSNSLCTEASMTPWVVTTVAGLSNCIVAVAEYIGWARAFQ